LFLSPKPDPPHPAVIEPPRGGFITPGPPPLKKYTEFSYQGALFVLTKKVTLGGWVGGWGILTGRENSAYTCESMSFTTTKQQLNTT